VGKPWSLQTTNIQQTNSTNNNTILPTLRAEKKMSKEGEAMYEPIQTSGR